jgi:hypothetical protein
MDVIGVGGVDRNNLMSVFSSRGMTTWELPLVRQLDMTVTA